MTCSVADVIQVIEKLAPVELSSSWDNAGLQVGHGDWPVQTVWVALDPLPEVVADACRARVDLLVTHHPLIFKPLNVIDMATPEGAIIEAAIQNQLAIYAAHTNLDAVEDGLNDILCRKIGLEDIGGLPVALEDDMQDFLRIGSLPKTTTLTALARKIKRRLGIDAVRIAGKPDLNIDSVAVCCGSGSSLLPAFLLSGVEVFVSGDLKYHDARIVEGVGKGLVDIGHFASEHVMVDALADRLDRNLQEAGFVVRVSAVLSEKDPFVIV